MNTNTMSTIAQALITAQDYKSLKINGALIGVKEALAWKNAVKALRLPAYAVRAYRYDNLGKAEEVASCDQSKLYDALRLVINIIGEVNGAKLNAHNIAEEIIANTLKLRVIDITPEMASARLSRKTAKAKLTENDTEENQAEFDKWDEEVKRLESEAGNCKKIKECVKENPFITIVEKILSDAITAQTLKTPEQVQAEEEALKAERKARAKARKAAKQAK